MNDPGWASLGIAIVLLAGFVLSSSYVARDAFGEHRLPSDVRAIVGQETGGIYSLVVGILFCTLLQGVVLYALIWRPHELGPIGIISFFAEAVAAFAWLAYLRNSIRNPE